MPRSGCSALHGGESQLKKKKNQVVNVIFTCYSDHDKTRILAKKLDYF